MSDKINKNLPFEKRLGQVGLAWKECQSNLIWEAIELLEKGYTDKEIMDKLKIGIKTIKKCKKIMIKIKNYKID